MTEAECKEAIDELVWFAEERLNLFVSLGNQYSKSGGIAILGRIDGVILVGQTTSYKETLMILLHEIGHLTKLSVSNKKYRLSLRVKAGSEEAANQTACRMICVMQDLDPDDKMDLVTEYAEYYNGVNAAHILTNKRKSFIPDIYTLKGLADRCV